MRTETQPAPLRQRKSRPEIFLLLLMGVSPQTLINRGYSKSSVYQAHRKLPAVQKRINEFFSGASPHM